MTLYSFRKYGRVNIYLLDCSLEAFCESSNSCQTAVIRSAADKQRLFQVKIYVQILTRQGTERRFSRKQRW